MDGQNTFRKNSWNIYMPAHTLLVNVILEILLNGLRVVGFTYTNILLNMHTFYYIWKMPIQTP